MEDVYYPSKDAADAYRDAMEILSEGSPTLAEVGLELAKSQPLLFCRLANKIKKTVPRELEERVRSVYRAEGFIAAIKYYREQTGASLFDAKETVEAITGHRHSPGL